MMKNGLFLPRKLSLFISILGLAFIFLGIFFKITHMSYLGLSANILFVVGTILSAVALIFVLIDVIISKPENWILWLIFLIIFGNITTMIYLFNKKVYKKNISR